MEMIPYYAGRPPVLRKMIGSLFVRHDIGAGALLPIAEHHAVVCALEVRPV